MRILIAHNHYQQTGGEDTVVRAEGALLKDFKEEVEFFERTNAEIQEASYLKRLKLLSCMSFSQDSYVKLRAVLKRFRPDVVHFHNIFFMLTPAVYQACLDEGIPIVQSLHNFRLLCANALFFRDNKICEKCVDKKSLNPGIWHRCYKQSHLLSAVVVNTIRQHWEKRTWHQTIDHYILASEFGRQKYIAAGIPANKISVKPNIIYPDIPKQNQDRGYALYVGRLSVEKGVAVLLKAWKSIDQIPLKIAGSGTLADELKAYAQEHNIRNVEFLGFISDDQYKEYMSGAKFLIIPSICYENFPCIVVEAYSYGIPIVASALGSLPEVVLDKITGLIFKPGDSCDLVKKVEWLATHDEELSHMRENVQRQYKENYSAQRIYEILMTTYHRVSKNLQIPY